MNSVPGQYWVVRHKPTHRVLPARLADPRQHWTHWDPASSDAELLAPRLFTREQAARQALVYWLQGTWVPELAPARFEDPEVLGIIALPRADRRAEDMEVIPVYLMRREIRQVTTT